MINDIIFIILDLGIVSGALYLEFKRLFRKDWYKDYD
jgi:hypothetical protein